MAGIATASGTPTYAARSVVGVRPGANVSVSFTDFASGNPDRFYIDIVSSAPAAGSNGSRSSSKFMLDRNFPFDVIFPSRFSRMSADAVRDLISYDPAKNVLAANLAAIYSRGFFDFDIILRMAADGTAPFRKTESVPVLKVQALPAAEGFFSKVSVRVEKPENPDMHRVVVAEDERIDNVNLFDLETGTPGGCDDRPYRLTADGVSIRSAAGVQSYTSLDIRATYRVPANFPLWTVDDQSSTAIFRSTVLYPGANPLIRTQIRHTEYNFANEVFFYDQVITRRLQSPKAYAGNHPLMRVQDLFGAAVPHENGQPMLEFRREYVRNESASVDEHSRRDANFMAYLDPLMVMSSSLSVPVINVRLRRNTPKDMSCSIRWLVNGNSLLKNREEIHLEATTEWGDPNGAKKKRTRTLRIRRNVSDSHPWCRNTTYGSGDTDASSGYPLRLLTVKDMLEILRLNISGTVDGNTPYGDSSAGGLFPTFSEIGEMRVPDPEQPVVEWEVVPNYYGCYLLPAHRLTFGSKLLQIGGEVGEISFGLRPASILCKGLEKDVSMDNLCCIMPLNRKIGEAGVRGSIKEFGKHAEDGDFDPAGRAYNRFYKDWTIASAARIFREGRDYFSVRARRSGAEVDMAYGSAPPRRGREAGAQRRLVGAAHLGICLSFLEEDAEGAGRFGSESPSYLVSRIVADVPSEASSADVVASVDSIGSSGVCLVYVDSPMFESPRTSLSPSLEDDLLDMGDYPHGKDGSVWSVVYTTGAGSGIRSEEGSLTSSYISGSHSLLDPMLHGPKYRTMAEGGELEESARTVQIHPCYDLPGRLSPTSSFALEDLLDFGSATGRPAGNYAKVSVSPPSLPGVCPIGGKGSKSVELSYVARKTSTGQSVTLSVDGGAPTALDQTFGGFEDSLWAQVGAMGRLTSSSVVRRPDPMPWLELDFSKYTLGLGADMPDDPYLARYPDPYLGEVDPYQATVITPGVSGMREYAYRDINPRIGLRINWRKKVVEPRSFSFFLRDRRFRSLADLRDDINRRLGRFGIQASAEVANPELRDQRELVASDRAVIMMVDDFDVPSEGFDPYFYAFRRNPRGDDPYAVFDPYTPGVVTQGTMIRTPAILEGQVNMVDLTPSTAAQVVVHLRPFGGRRAQTIVTPSSSARTAVHDPAGKVTPPTGWSWSQDSVSGVLGRVLRRNSETKEGVPVLPDLPQGMTWKQLNGDVWYPYADGIVPIPTEKPRERNDG